MNQQSKNLFQPSPTINPQALAAISLDDIASGINELIKIETDNQKLLANSYGLLADILSELRENQDEGGDLPSHGIVTTSDFIFLDTITNPGHPVKAFLLKNDGPNSIYMGFNVTKAGLQPTISDITSTLSRFREVKNKEVDRFIFNKRKIENVAFITTSGSSSYRCSLVW